MANPKPLEAVDDWVAAGLITADQARAIRAHESARDEEGLPGWVEPVSYLGAALIAVALFLFGAQIWDQLAVWGRITLSTLMTVVLLATGSLLRRSQSDAAARAAAFTWLLAVGGVAGTTGMIVSEAFDLAQDWEPILIAGVSLVAAVPLYLIARTTLQQIGVAASTVFLLATVPLPLPLGQEPWMIGLMFLTAGAAWLLLTWAGIMEPQGTGWVLGSLLAIGVGFGAFDDNPLWSGIGVLVGLGLVWLSTRVDRRSLLGLGVLALVIWIPTTVTIAFEDSIAVPVAILITGFVTLTVVVAAVVHGRRQEKSEVPTKGASR